MSASACYVVFCCDSPVQVSCGHISSIWLESVKDKCEFLLCVHRLTEMQGVEYLEDHAAVHLTKTNSMT